MRRIFKNKRLLLAAIIILATILRFWKLDVNPPSLFGDELDVGYHAYSILKTGRDYSGNFMPLHFRSLAEWRTPLYLYSAVPTVAIWGISGWGVRVPAAFFGVIGIYFAYLLFSKLSSERIGLLSAFILAISPWHIHYSRAGFEVTLLIALLLAGTYFFIRGLKDGRWLFFASLFLGLTPWAYNTAKLFLPLFVLIIVAIYLKEIVKVPKIYLISALVVFTIVVAPFAYSTVFGGGAERFNLISIFNDNELEGTIGFERVRDQKMQSDPFLSRILHNKYVYWSKEFADNYLASFSTSFLFINGDIIPRHNSSGAGMLYKIETIFLLAGLYFLFKSKLDRKTKYLLVAWLLIAPIPSALTKDGGTHATRLILMLPVLVFAIAYGIGGLFNLTKKNVKPYFVGILVLVYLVSIISYQHYYWVHYPWDSEKWWQAGWQEAIRTSVDLSKNFNKVIISSADEPALIFFLSWSQYPPRKFQNIGIEPKTYLDNFGKVIKLDNYYFPEVGQGYSLYELGSNLPENSLYVAPIREVNIDLVAEPDRLPSDLNLVKTILSPSGHAVFYLLTKSR